MISLALLCFILPASRGLIYGSSCMEGIVRVLPQHQKHFYLSNFPHKHHHELATSLAFSLPYPSDASLQSFKFIALWRQNHHFCWPPARPGSLPASAASAASHCAAVAHPRRRSDDAMGTGSRRNTVICPTRPSPNTQVAQKISPAPQGDAGQTGRRQNNVAHPG